MSAAIDELAAMIYDLQKQVEKLGGSSQAGNSTVGGEDAIPVAGVVAEAAITNAALPGVQDDIAAGDESVSDLSARFDTFDDDLDARFDEARAELDDARAEIADSQQDLTDAFGQQFDGMSTDIQTAITAAGNAQSSADAKPLILFSAVRGPSNQSDLAPTGSTWFYLDGANNIAGQWQQTGPQSAPTWTPRQIVSDVVANLDLGKLTAGQAAIATVVAQKIAASTANFQTVNVSNLFVTDGATMNQATIDYLFANVVQAKKITASMIDVNSLNGVTITGLTIVGGVFRTAASGQRAELATGRLRFFDTSGAQRGTILAADGKMILYSGAEGSPALVVGPYTIPYGTVVQGTSYNGLDVTDLWVGNLRDRATGAVYTPGPTIRSGSGTYSGGNIAANRGNVTVTVNFPSGSFSSPPNVILQSGNSRILATVSSVTATQLRILLLNYTDTTITSSVDYSWVALSS